MKSNGGIPLSNPAKHVVIVVDDDPQVREALEDLLHTVQLTVAVFASAEDLLSSDILVRANCLISDIRMPGMQGFELQTIVKQLYPELPVFLITGHREESDAQRALSSGAQALFYKPLDPDDLLDAVQAAIADHRRTS